MANKSRPPRATPTLCPHCIERGEFPRYVYSPPGWMRVLYALRSGIKGDRLGTVGTQSQIAERMGVSREQARQLVTMALTHGALERPFGSNTGIYRKSAWGKQVLQMWISAGWAPEKRKVTQDAARKERKMEKK